MNENKYSVFYIIKKYSGLIVMALPAIVVGLILTILTQGKLQIMWLLFTTVIISIYLITVFFIRIRENRKLS